jgi:hypothetical protein
MALATDKLTLIETAFIGRLIESKLYGDPKEGLAAELAAAAPDGLTPANLAAAANAVIRRRNNGSFPALPACLAEIERHCFAPAERPDNGYAAGGVTKDNYAELAIAHGRKAGGLTVIRSAEDPEAWSAWRAYYGSIGMMGSELMMVGASTWTVPSKFPQHFDTSYTPRRLVQVSAPVGERKTTKQIDDARHAMRVYSASQKPKQTPEQIKTEADTEARMTLLLEAAAKSDSNGKPHDPSDPVWAKLAAENAALSPPNIGNEHRQERSAA